MRNEIQGPPANDGVHDEMKGPPSRDGDERACTDSRTAAPGRGETGEAAGRHPSAATPFEAEIDGVVAFRFIDLFKHTPPESCCSVCGRKHFNWGPDCDSCRGAA